MANLTTNNFLEPFVILLRKGTEEDPYVNITETIALVQNIQELDLTPLVKAIAVLRELPVETYGVTAKVQPLSAEGEIELIEIRDSITQPDATHFKVDYTNGRVYLSQDYKDRYVKFIYQGRGVVCVNSDRVILTTGGDLSDLFTLADFVDMELSELKIGNLNDLLTTDKTYVVNAINEVYNNSDNVLDALNAHKIDYTNSHQVTATQVGLGNVDNTSDTDKPVSTAQKTYIDDADELLQDQIDALRGSFIYIGSINLNTADVTQALLNARALELMGGTTVKLGWVLIDNEKHEWYYNANITTWIDFEQPNVYQASNAIYGIVKGDGTDVSITNGLITVNNADNAAKLGGTNAIDYATKSYVDANGGTVILLDVADTAPTTCSVGDIYFNTVTNLLYNCEVINTWGTGYEANSLKIYIDSSDDKSYYYDGITLVSTSGMDNYDELLNKPIINADNLPTAGGQTDIYRVGGEYYRCVPKYSYYQDITVGVDLSSAILRMNFPEYPDTITNISYGEDNLVTVDSNHYISFYNTTSSGLNGACRLFNNGNVLVYLYQIVSDRGITVSDSLSEYIMPSDYGIVTAINNANLAYQYIKADLFEGYEWQRICNNNVVFVGYENSAPAEARIIIDNEYAETKASEVVNSLDGTSTTMAPSVDAVNNKININKAVIGNETDTYSASSTYALGSLVIYNSLLYKCTTAITVAEAWTIGHWTQVSLTSIADSGDVYSTSEVKTNKIWIDGKPIYRKIFDITVPGTLGAWTTLTNINITNFDEFVNLYGKLFFDTNTHYPIPYTVSSTDCILLRFNNKVLEYYTTSINYINKRIYIILEYIKTTD